VSVQKERDGNRHHSAMLWQHGSQQLWWQQRHSYTEGKRQWQQPHSMVTAVADNSCHCSWWGEGILLTASPCSGGIAAISGGESPWQPLIQKMTNGKGKLTVGSCTIKVVWWQHMADRRQAVAMTSGKAAAMASFGHPVAAQQLAQWRRHSSCLWQSPLTMSYCQEWQWKATINWWNNQPAATDDSSSSISRSKQWHWPLQQFLKWSRLTIKWWWWQKRQQVDVESASEVVSVLWF